MVQQVGRFPFEVVSTGVSGLARRFHNFLGFLEDLGSYLVDAPCQQLRSVRPRWRIRLPVKHHLHKLLQYGHRREFIQELVELPIPLLILA